MNKHFVLLIAIMISFTAVCQKESSVENHKLLTIKVNEPVNGYTVTIYFIPKLNLLHRIRGAAIFEFMNPSESTSFTITNNHFSFPDNNIEAVVDDDGNINYLITKEITIDYLEPSFQENGSLDYDNLPLFFFYDFNFDGEDELVITERGNGSKGMDTFKAYSVYDGFLDYEVNQITNKKPYSELNIGTRFLKSRKELYIYHIHGFCADTYDIYKVANDTYGSKTLQLTGCIEYEADYYGDDNKCYKNVYEMRDGEKVLIEKTEVDN